MPIFTCCETFPEGSECSLEKGFSYFCCFITSPLLFIQSALK